MTSMSTTHFRAYEIVMAAAAAQMPRKAQDIAAADSDITANATPLTATARSFP